MERGLRGDLMGGGGDRGLTVLGDEGYAVFEVRKGCGMMGSF